MATFFADSAGSQGTGTGVSEANACTLKEAMENDGVLHTALVAGSTIWVKNGTGITFDGSLSTFVSPTINGTAIAPIRVKTFTTSTGDGGVTSVTDTDAGATNNCFDMGSVSYWMLEGFKVIDPRRGIRTATTNGHYFRNIEIDNFAAFGVEEGGGTGDLTVYENCFVHDGSGDGFSSDHRAGRFINCVSTNNTGDGFDIGNDNYGATTINCIAHNNGGKGFDINGEYTGNNCVANGNTSDGFNIARADRVNILVNCGSTSNGGFGITGVTNSTAELINCSMNPTNETNTSGKSSVIVLHEIDEVTGDPEYVDSSPATEPDLSLGAGSAWRSAGSGLGGDGWTV